METRMFSCCHLQNVCFHVFSPFSTHLFLPPLHHNGKRSIIALCQTKALTPLLLNVMRGGGHTTE